MNKITWIAPAHGNPIALLRTMSSLKDVCDEFIIGDLCVFKGDSYIFKSYKKDFNLKIINLPFNFLFIHGFSKCLNELIEFSSNNIVLYLNVGEIISQQKNMDQIIDEYNCWYIDHPVEKHRWWRCFDKRYVKWSGRIHEESVPINEMRPYHKPIFTFEDTDKDMDDIFKAKVYDDIKELCYFENYNTIVDYPNQLAGTDPGWIKFATENYESMKYRLNQKGKRYKAFQDGDLRAYFDGIYESDHFEKERFESNTGIEFQNNPMFLDKK